MIPGALSSGHNPEDSGCDCRECLITDEIVTYMMCWMPPTDRALRLPPERD